VRAAHHQSCTFDPKHPRAPHSITRTRLTPQRLPLVGPRDPSGAQASQQGQDEAPAGSTIERTTRSLDGLGLPAAPAAQSLLLPVLGLVDREHQLFASISVPEPSPTATRKGKAVPHHGASAYSREVPPILEAVTPQTASEHRRNRFDQPRNLHTDFQHRRNSAPLVLFFRLRQRSRLVRAVMRHPRVRLGLLYKRDLGQLWVR
jgi:hypothetical protein